jgi:hypothetical protein
MIIEQTKEQIDDAISFHTHAEISSLRLARARVWSRAGISRAVGRPVSLDINFKPGAFTIEDGSLLVETDFVFVINQDQTEKPGERQPLVVVECCFEAEYRFTPDYRPSEQQIEAFRSANAVFNCWPFFREFVQTSVTRMHFPPPPVPFLRITLKVEKPTIEAAGGNPPDPKSP